MSSIWLGAGPARGQTCSFDAASATLSVETSSRRTYITAVASTGAIELNGAPCGDATVLTTDRIQVTGTDGVDPIRLSGRFEPGMTPEVDGTSEIEIAMTLGYGSNNVRVNFPNGHDHVRLTAHGFDVGDDGDEDILIDSPLYLGLYVDGGGGNDHIDATDYVGSVSMQGGPGNDDLVGSAYADTIDGEGGDDSIHGGGGNDYVGGGDGDDLVIGGDGDDTLYEDDGANGADDMRGGAGIDVVSYFGRSIGVSVTIGNDLADDGEPGEGDNVEASVENLEGGSGSDVLVGSARANRLDGRRGSDVLDGGRGADVLIGGEGRDQVTYALRTVPVTVTIGNGLADDGEDSEGDMVDGTVDDVVGGLAPNVLVGSSSANHLTGGPAGDELYGGGGNDVLTGGPAGDILVGDDGDDRLIGQAGADTLDGGPGADTFIGGSGDDILYNADGIAESVDCGDGFDDPEPEDIDTFVACEAI